MNKISLFLLALVSASASSSNEFSEFNNEINKAQETVDRSKRLLPHNQIHLLLEKKPDLVPEKQADEQPVADDKSPQGVPTKPDQGSASRVDPTKADQDAPKTQVSGDREENTVEPVADAESKAKAKADKAAAAARYKKQMEQAAKAKKKPKPANTKPVYVSPLLSNASSEGGSNQASVKMPKGRQIRYGITIGTKIAVELSEGASSVQPGYTSVKLLESVVGYKSVLPAGSIVFARPKAVLGSDRLFLTASKVLDISNHDEFAIQGNVRAEDGNAGLYASVVSDPRDFKRAATAGENAIVSGVIDSIASDSIVGNASKVTAEMLQDQKEQKQNFENGQVALVVEALPQKAFLIIEQTF